MRHIVALDFETTGLHPVYDHILEVGALIVDEHLNELDSFHRLVHPTSQKLSRMNDYVQQMHTKNRLLEELKTTSAQHHSLEQLDRSLFHWLHQEHDIDLKNAIILGSSCRLDLDLIEMQLPQVSTMFTHRMLDVSGYNELTQIYVPEIDFPQPSTDETGELTAHRALDDARWSLAQARIQRDTLRQYKP